MTDNVIDPLALELNRDLNLAAAGEAQGRYTLGLWDNEDLAKVCNFVYHFRKSECDC